jgi:hypothetical protein
LRRSLRGTQKINFIEARSFGPRWRIRSSFLEAAKRLDPAVRERYLNIHWKAMIGMRDILSHQYDTINLKEIWDTIQRDVPGLLAELREIQSALRR